MRKKDELVRRENNVIDVEFREVEVKEEKGAQLDFWGKILMVTGALTIGLIATLVLFAIIGALIGQ